MIFPQVGSGVEDSFFASFAAMKEVAMFSAWPAALAAQIATSRIAKMWRHSTSRTSREIRE